MSKLDEIWQKTLGDRILPMWIDAMTTHFTLFQNLDNLISKIEPVIT